MQRLLLAPASSYSATTSYSASTSHATDQLRLYPPASSAFHAAAASPASTLSYAGGQLLRHERASASAAIPSAAAARAAAASDASAHRYAVGQLPRLQDAAADPGYGCLV